MGTEVELEVAPELSASLDCGPRGKRVEEMLGAVQQQEALLKP